MVNPYEIPVTGDLIVPPVNTDKRTRIFIWLAVIFGGIYVGLKIIAFALAFKNYNINWQLGLLAESIIGIALVLGLLLKSRICAVALFALTAGLQTYRIILSSTHANAFWAVSIVVVIIIIVPLFLGVLGTFAFHKAKKVASAKNPNP